MAKAASKDQKVGMIILEVIREDKLLTATCHTCQQPVAIEACEGAAERIGDKAMKAIKAREKKDKAAAKAAKETAKAKAAKGEGADQDPPVDPPEDPPKDDK